MYVYCKLCTLSAMKNVHAALTLKGWQHWLLWMFERHLPIKKNQTDQITYLVPCCAQNITPTLRDCGYNVHIVFPIILKYLVFGHAAIL